MHEAAHFQPIVLLVTDAKASRSKTYDRHITLDH